METYKKYINEEKNDVTKWLRVIKDYADEGVRYFEFGDTKQAKNNIHQIEKVLGKIKKTSDYKNL